MPFEDKLHIVGDRALLQPLAEKRQSLVIILKRQSLECQTWFSPTMEDIH